MATEPQTIARNLQARLSTTAHSGDQPRDDCSAQIRAAKGCRARADDRPQRYDPRHQTQPSKPEAQGHSRVFDRWCDRVDHPARGGDRGQYRGDDLVIVGRRIVPLSPAQSAELDAVLTPAKPGHPWPDEITSQRWRGKDSKKPLTKVEPPVVAEGAADAATAGQVRHSMRFIRLRSDLAPDDLDQLDS